VIASKLDRIIEIKGNAAQKQWVEKVTIKCFLFTDNRCPLPRACGHCYSSQLYELASAVVRAQLTQTLPIVVFGLWDKVTCRG
jgi:hypothetical protein